MAKTETQIDLKINKGTYEKIQANLNSIQENELIVTDDMNMPLPDELNEGKGIISHNNEYVFGDVQLKNLITDIETHKTENGSYPSTKAVYDFCQTLQVPVIEASNINAQPLTQDQLSVLTSNLKKPVIIYDTLQKDFYYKNKEMDNYQFFQKIVYNENSNYGIKQIRVALSNGSILVSPQSFELVGNKKASVASNSSSDTYYPTTKAVYDFVKDETKYIIVANYLDLPTSNVTNGTLAYVNNDSSDPVENNGFWQYNGLNWVKKELEAKIVSINVSDNAPDPTQTYTFTISSGDFLTLGQGARLQLNFYPSHEAVILFYPNLFRDGITTFQSNIICVINNNQYIATMSVDGSQQSNNATLSFSEIEGGGSGGGGSTGIPKYKLYFKQYSNLTLNRGDSGDQDFTADVNRVIGFEFYSKDIITRYNEYITFVNAQYSTSFANATSENDIPNLIKTMIATFLGAGLDTLTIYNGIQMLIQCLSINDDNITLADYLTYYYNNSFENLYPIQMFGTTSGVFESDSIFEYDNYYTGVQTQYGALSPSLYGNGSMTGFGSVSNQNTTVTGIVYLSLVDNYDCILETLDIGGGSSEGSGSGTLWYQHLFTLHDAYNSGDVRICLTLPYDLTTKFVYYVNQALSTNYTTIAECVEAINQAISYQMITIGQIMTVISVLQDIDDDPINSISTFCLHSVDPTYWYQLLQATGSGEIIAVAGSSSNGGTPATVYQQKYQLNLPSSIDILVTPLGNATGGGSSQPTIPERFSLAYNLVVNINQEQFANGSWTGSNSDNIRTFQYNGSNADETKAKELVEFLTGVPVLDEYNATKPTPCFVFCTQSNICWKLQWESNALKAYKVNNFPFVVKEKYYNIVLHDFDDNNLPVSLQINIRYGDMQNVYNSINQVLGGNISTPQEVIAVYDSLKADNISNQSYNLLCQLFVGLASVNMLHNLNNLFSDSDSFTKIIGIGLANISVGGGVFIFSQTLNSNKISFTSGSTLSIFERDNPNELD